MLLGQSALPCLWTVLVTARGKSMRPVCIRMSGAWAAQACARARASARTRALRSLLVCACCAGVRNVCWQVQPHRRAPRRAATAAATAAPAPRRFEPRRARRARAQRVHRRPGGPRAGAARSARARALLAGGGSAAKCASQISNNGRLFEGAAYWRALPAPPLAFYGPAPVAPPPHL
ncbi:MAG: hypothetical protein J3K34DRAFT_413523 [Monoraphidium minutum]|nr:MAG: hypothetical protein J3K34DRAFT_413523 [Monoraphidium minutum]